MKPGNKYAVIVTGALFVLFVLTLVFLPETRASEPNLASHGVKTVVIDPGHGGHDAGCLGSSAYEKHVALAISLKLGKFIEEKYPDVKVIYTRKTDVFVELYRRAQIANENKADLFICIHCNSGPKAAFGTETYVMGLHKSQDNLNVAKRENAVILQEDNYEKQYEGFDPNSAEANIIFSLYQNAFLDQSLYFAGEVQHELTHFAKRHNRGVKQAGFLVLFKTTMPSVLIETGFLTNPEEEKYLKAPENQQIVAESILRAFSNYKTWIDGASLKHEQTGPVIKSDDKPVTQINNPPALKPDATVYRVQIFSSGIKYQTNHPIFKNRKDIWMYSSGGIWKYTAGSFDKEEDAVNLQAELKAQGFSDAFVVAFKNGERINMKDARAYQP